MRSDLAILLACLVPVILACACPETVRAVELPGIGELLGVKNPLESFPEDLPPRFGYRITAEMNDFYRSEKGPELQRYGAWSTTTLALTRVGSAWFGLHAGNGALELTQREVHGKADRLDGARSSDNLALAFAYRDGAFEARATLGESDSRPGGALELRHALGPFERLTGRGWVSSSALDLDQSIDGRGFDFPFSYRDECAEIEAVLHPIRGYRWSVAGARKLLVGTEAGRNESNSLYASRWRLATVIERIGSPRFDLRGFLEPSTFSMTMSLDGTRYLQIRDLGLDRRGVEIGWRCLSGFRASIGYERWGLSSEDPSYVDLWPFTIWDVFRSTRYRLVAIDKQWNIAFARMTWDAPPVWNTRIGLDGRIEKWEDSGTIRWKERVAVLPPFFFRFDPHQNELDGSPTHAAQVDLDLAWQAGRHWKIRSIGRMTCPFRIRKGDGGPARGATSNEPETKTRGGLTLGVAIETSW